MDPLKDIKGKVLDLAVAAGDLPATEADRRGLEPGLPERPMLHAFLPRTATRLSDA